MSNPTPNTSYGPSNEPLEHTTAPAYVPYPTVGITEQNSPHRPPDGRPMPNGEEFRTNSAKRCVVVRVIDKSASMAGEPAR